MHGGVRTGCGSRGGGRASGAASARPRTLPWGCGLRASSRDPGAREAFFFGAWSTPSARQQQAAQTTAWCSPFAAQQGAIDPEGTAPAKGGCARTCARILPLVPAPGGLAEAGSDAAAQALALQLGKRLTIKKFLQTVTQEAPGPLSIAACKASWASPVRQGRHCQNDRHGAIWMVRGAVHSGWRLGGLQWYSVRRSPAPARMWRHGGH